MIETYFIFETWRVTKDGKKIRGGNQHIDLGHTNEWINRKEHHQWNITAKHKYMYVTRSMVNQNGGLNGNLEFEQKKITSWTKLKLKLGKKSY